MTGGIAPEAVYRACLRGLKRHDRARKYTADTGATAAALSFAEIIADGRPIDSGIAAELLEAHRLLDEMPRRPDGETEQQIVSRLLWGGDDAPEWAEALVAGERQAQLDLIPTDPAPEPVPVPVPVLMPVAAAPVDTIAAAIRDDQAALDDLSDELFDLDTKTIDQLRGAFWVSYRAALRASTSAARQTSSRVSKADQVAAGLDDDAINEARETIRKAGRYDGYLAIPDNVAAVVSVDLDRALTAALDDYQEVATGILAQSRTTAVRTVATDLGVEREDVEGLAPSDDSINVAALGLSVGLGAWVRARLQGDRDPEDLTKLAAPEAMFSRALVAASGAAPGDDEAGSIGAPIASRVIDRVKRGAMASRPSALAQRLIDRVVRPRWYWYYGDPATRPGGRYEDHYKIRQKSWSTPEERLSKTGGQFVGDHEGCQCQILRKWRVSTA